MQSIIIDVVLSDKPFQPFSILNVYVRTFSLFSVQMVLIGQSSYAMVLIGESSNETCAWHLDNLLLNRCWLQVLLPAENSSQQTDYYAEYKLKQSIKQLDFPTEVTVKFSMGPKIDQPVYSNALLH